MFVRINQRLLNKSVNKAGIADKVAAAQIIEIFSRYLIKIFGPQALNMAKPLYIKNKSLIIRVENSLAATEIKKREDAIISLLKETTHSSVKRLVFIS